MENFPQRVERWRNRAALLRDLADQMLPIQSTAADRLRETALELEAMALQAEKTFAARCAGVATRNPPLAG
jgi:hypothetical protein